MKVVDFRIHPPIPEWRPFTTVEFTRRLSERLGVEELPASYLEQSMERFMAEMDAAGIDMGVMESRHGGGKHLSDDTLAAVQQAYPGKIRAIASLDLDQDMDAILAGMDRAAKALDLRIFSVHPDIAATPAHVDDVAFSPIFERALELGCPVLVSSGPVAGPDISWSDPIYVDRLAARFPNLRIIASHGCWPHAAEAVGLVYRRENVTVSTDGYLYMPGGEAYVAGIRQFPRQFVWGSFYPFRSMAEAARLVQTLPLDERVLEHYMSANALRLLGE